MKTSINQIEEFLSVRKIAFAGVSRQEKDFSRSLFREFLNRGYQGIPVNPHTDRIEDLPCFPGISSLEEIPEAVMVLTAPAETETVIKECLDCGISHLWVINKKGYETIGAETKQRLKEANVSLIAGECPFMFLQEAAWIHRFHGWIAKMTGSYPKA